MNSLIFVSYSSQDKEKVENICEFLALQGIELWVAFKNIAPGEDWDRTLQTALKSTAHILLIVSKTSVESPYVRAEVEYALNAKKKVIPLVIEDYELPPRWHTLQSLFLYNT